MQHSLPHSASSVLPTGESELSARWGREDRTYQAMTIAAIVTVLASIWVF